MGLSAVEGKALFIGSMHSKYAHVKIKMYAPSDDFSRIIWNVPEIELPLKFRDTITKGLEFFLGFNLVTTRTIINCFAPDYFDFKANRVFRQTSFKGGDTRL